MIVNTYVHTFGIIITVKTPIHYKFFATPIVKNTFSLEDSRSDLAVFYFYKKHYVVSDFLTRIAFNMTLTEFLDFPELNVYCFEEDTED